MTKPNLSILRYNYIWHKNVINYERFFRSIKNLNISMLHKYYQLPGNDTRNPMSLRKELMRIMNHANLQITS